MDVGHRTMVAQLGAINALLPINAGLLLGLRETRSRLLKLRPPAESVSREGDCNVVVGSRHRLGSG